MLKVIELGFHFQKCTHTHIYIFEVTLYFTTRKQLCKYTEITVYVSVIIVYFHVSIREQYVKFGVIKG